VGLTTAVGEAVRALRINKGRSALTSLGIIIGIGAVITLVAAGQGARRKLEDQLESVGKDVILVRAGARTQQGLVADYAALANEDVAAVRREAGPLLVGVAPVELAQRLAVTRWGRWPTAVVGSTPEMERIRRWRVVSGRFYTAEEVKRQAPVCLLGQTVRRKLFPGHADPVGQTVRVEHLRLEVVGVLGEKGRSPTGADQDDQIFVPITTLQRRLLGEERIMLIVAAARSEADLPVAKERVERALRRGHRLAAGTPNDFDVSTVREMGELAEVLTGTMQALVAVIASISLVVGGIGIMNIMLVSVTERTREIGLRMALGATGADVMGQFLTEAVILALFGGLLGVALGVAGAAAFARALDWPLLVSPGVVAVGFAVAAGVGVFFGFYPARKASRLDPIEALRSE
jgi:putative ABC transport system permease protein